MKISRSTFPTKFLLSVAGAIALAGFGAIAPAVRQSVFTVPRAAIAQEENLENTENTENSENLTANQAFEAGHAAFHEDKYEEAIERYTDAIEKYRAAADPDPDPNLARAFVFLGTVYERAGQYYRRIGQNREAVGSYKAAVAVHDEAIALQPDYSAAHYGRGVNLAFLVEYEEASEAFENALDGDGDWENRKPADAWNNLGAAQWRLEQYEDAEESFERALEEDPDHELAKDNLQKLREFSR